MSELASESMSQRLRLRKACERAINPVPGEADRAQRGSAMSSRIVVTGGAGFLGTLLAVACSAARSRSAARPRRTSPGSWSSTVAAPADDSPPTPRGAIEGELSRDLGEGERRRLPPRGRRQRGRRGRLRPGMHTNLDGTRAVLEYARGHAVPPVVVFTSSLAVFGSDPASVRSGPSTTTPCRARSPATGSRSSSASSWSPTTRARASCAGGRCGS